MDTRYDDVEFSFVGLDDEEDPTALGTVLVRADGEMVLMLAESDDEPPFCEIAAKAVEGAFAGENQRREPAILAQWRMDGRNGAGTWVEQGQTLKFSFGLP